MQKTISYLALVIIVFVYIDQNIEIEKAQIIKDIIYFSIIVFALGLILNLFIPSFTIYRLRYKGILGNPNGVGLFSIMMSILYFWAHQYKIFKNNSPILIGWFLLIISLILSNSRSGLGTILIFFSLYFLMRSNKKIKIGFFGFFLPLVLLIFINFSFLEIINLLGLNEYLRVESIADGSGRLIAWKFAQREIPKNLWLGRGFEYNAYIYDFLLPESIRHYRELSSSWNSHLNFLLDTGLIGYLLFFRFLGKNVIKFKDKAVIIPFSAAFLFSAFYEAWLSASLNSFTIYFFIAIILFQYPKDYFNLNVREEH